ncbi:MAG TPA: methylamine dehydrogenase light chain [Woeseiaceae bacterium]
MNWLNWLDRIGEHSARQVARTSSRRSFLARLGVLVAGGAASVPLLPVARGQESAAREPAPDEAGKRGPEYDPTSCEYWRHCAIDGFACACCGGSQSSCPPGTELAGMTWLGTCRNPDDGRDYIISYNDCCGKGSCGQCLCNRNEGDLPMWMPPKNNDTNWCQGVKSQSYHCTIAAVVGVATQES